jgi:cell division protein FtsB
MVADFSKKQNRGLGKNKIFSILGLVLFLAICGFLIAADIKVFNKKQELSLQLESLKKEIQKIETSNEKLKQGIANSENNDYIEKVAREELDLQKPGEKVISFVVPKGQNPENKNNFTASKNWLGWISGTWQWLLGKK